MQKPNLNKPAFQVFQQARALVQACYCPFCPKEIIESEFRDALSKRGYSISGLCQSCQDKMFGE